MNAKQALRELKSLGTAQNKKVYARHGVGEPMFGVSYANIYKLQKRIGVDHEVAEELWASGVHDARVLASMVADPARMNPLELEKWVRELDNYVLSDALSGVAARSPKARELVRKWTASRDEWIGATGWNVLAHLAMQDGELPPTELERHLKTIEERIHASRNRTRYSMNNALIAIGMTSPDLERKAVAAAKRIGRVEVDHGQTGCKTPDAVTYIPKAAAHHRKKAAKAAGRKKAAKAAGRKKAAKAAGKKAAKRAGKRGAVRKKA